MGIPVVCQSCGRTFSVKDKYAGQVGSCKFCHNTVRVPQREDEADELDVLFGDTDPSTTDSASLLNPVAIVRCPSCNRRNPSFLPRCAHCNASLTPE